MRRLLLLVAAFIIYGSLYPFQFDFDRFPDSSALVILLHSWPHRVDRFMWRDAGVNVLLYFPLGLAAALALGRKWPRLLAALAAVAFGTLLSASIEMLQIFDSSRTCSMMDVACNFAGSVGGACAALVFGPQILAISQRRKGDRGAGGALVLACCWAGYQSYPFIPLLGLWRLRHNLATFARTPISAVEVCASAGEWFAFGLVLRALAGRWKIQWLLLAMLCLPLRVLIADRTLVPAELLGALLAILAWTYPAEEPRVRGAAAALAAVILLRELSPFAFTAQASAMRWIPFAASFDGERLSAAVVLLRKAFEYGTLIWLLRASRVRYAYAGLAVAAGLMILETVQRYLPNRQPEVTDAVIAGLMACVLWGNERRARA